MTDQKKRDTLFSVSMPASTIVSADGGTNGLWSLHDTAERSMSSRSFVSTVFSIVEPSPFIAAASPFAMPGHPSGNSRPPRMNRRARPLVRMPGRGALGTASGFAYSPLTKSSTRPMIAFGSSPCFFASGHWDGPAFEHSWKKIL